MILDGHAKFYKTHCQCYTDNKIYSPDYKIGFFFVRNQAITFVN